MEEFIFDNLVIVPSVDILESKLFSGDEESTQDEFEGMHSSWTTSLKFMSLSKSFPLPKNNLDKTMILILNIISFTMMLSMLILFLYIMYIMPYFNVSWVEDFITRTSKTS